MHATTRADAIRGSGLGTRREDAERSCKELRGAARSCEELRGEPKLQCSCRQGRVAEVARKEEEGRRERAD